MTCAFATVIVLADFVKIRTVQSSIYTLFCIHFGLSAPIFMHAGDIQLIGNTTISNVLYIVYRLQRLI